MKHEWRFPYNPDLIVVAKSLKMRWNPEAKCWWSEDPEVGVAIAGGTPKVVELAKARQAKDEVAVSKSRATNADIAIPCPDGLMYLPFQKAGIAYAIERENVFIADEMGLGKSVESVGVINVDATLNNVLIICPASLKLNWARELRRWLTREMSIELVNGGFPTSNIVILNFDILKNWMPEIHARKWDLLIVDEAHKLKNKKAMRTKLVLGYKELVKKTDTADQIAEKEKKNIPAIQARRRLFLTGTPIVNRPVELFTLLEAIDPNGLGKNFFAFAKRYCDAKQTRYGWDFSGHSNLEELQTKMRATCFAYDAEICSPGGNIKIGDIVENEREIDVWSYNFASAKVERGRVVAFSKRQAPNKLLRVVHEFGEFVCTADHKIWTEKGYNRADTIGAGVCLSVLYEEKNDQRSRCTDKCEVLLDKMCSKSPGDSRCFEAESEPDKIIEAQRCRSKDLSLVQNTHSSSDQQWRVQCSLGFNDVLQPVVFEQMESSERRKLSFGDCENDRGGDETIAGEKENRGSKARCKSTWKKDVFGIKREDVGRTKIELEQEKNNWANNWVSSDIKTTTSSASVPRLSKRVAGGIDTDTTHNRRFSEGAGLQSNGGHCSSSIENSDRDRWENTPHGETSGQGCLEKCTIKKSRVVSVEILELGSGSGCNENSGRYKYVYDIEVEGNHNFFANGCLVSNCMVRRLKADVLKELPPKRRQIIVLPPDGMKEALKAEIKAVSAHEAEMEKLAVDLELSKALDGQDAYMQIVTALSNVRDLAFEEISAARRAMAIAKAPFVAEYAKDLLDEEEAKKIIIFAHHHEVIDTLFDAFGKDAVKLDGRMGIKAKQESVDRFQSDPTCKVFIGSIQAAGVGITLTAANMVLFAELDWVPGNVTQAEDRAHRLGQLDSVLVQHLVVDGSIDSRMAKFIVAKQDVIDRALDNPVEMANLKGEVIIPVERPGTASTPKSEIDKIALRMTEDAKVAIDNALMVLTGNDPDHAMTRNDVGFNRIDGQLGHRLAEIADKTNKQYALALKMCWKYNKTQLGGVLTPFDVVLRGEVKK